MQASDKIIWSADVRTMKALGRGIKAMDGLKHVKIDRAFLERRNPSIFDRIMSDHDGIKIFSDAKIVEIPTKIVEIALTHLRYRPWMLNCMAGDVSTMDLLDPDKLDGLKRFVDACRMYGTRSCAVTVLTSKSDKVVDLEFNGRTSVDQVLLYVDLLLQCGFTDVVCSPLEAAAIRSDSRFDGLDINTPGIVLAGGDAKDQARTNTPAGALAAGATRLVIGRALTVGNWADNYRRVAAEVDLVLGA